MRLNIDAEGIRAEPLIGPGAGRHGDGLAVVADYRRHRAPAARRAFGGSRASSREQKAQMQRHEGGDLLA